jgi:hypothetical protein
MDLYAAMTNRYFISYPKSGRTWLRYILFNLDLEANISFQHDGFEFNDGNRPPHNYDLGVRKKLYWDDARVVYLRRDPRDIMVSLYHQVTGRFNEYFYYQGSLSEFIRDPYFGAQVLARFRDIWQVLAENPGVLVVEYEDCHRDLEGVMRRILDHYGLAVKQKRLQKACNSAGLSQMRQLEKSGAFPHPWLNLRNGAPKVRRGQIGNYSTELSMEDILYLNGVFGLAEGLQQS